MKKVVIFGSTGSVGKETLSVIEKNSEDFCVLALIANKNLPLLEKQWEKFHPKHVGVADLSSGLIAEAEGMFCRSKLHIGEEASEIASIKDADIVVLASSGIASLSALLFAVEAGKHIAIANKETIVCCGDLVLERAKTTGAKLYPVDSEHSAIWQCLRGERKCDVEKIILTASGGNFLRTPLCELDDITPALATTHPTWKMGGKITVDSSTMMNKALELIEACRLFDVQESDIDVVIHPQSIVHSAVRYRDGSVICHASYPTMEIPILQGLCGGKRGITNARPLDFASVGSLTFENLQKDRHKAVWLARKVIKKGGFFPLYFCVAGEVLVERFFAGEIKFSEIVNKTEQLINNIDKKEVYSLQNLDKEIARAKDLAKEI